MRRPRPYTFRRRIVVRESICENHIKQIAPVNRYAIIIPRKPFSAHSPATPSQTARTGIRPRRIPTIALREADDHYLRRRRSPLPYTRHAIANSPHRNSPAANSYHSSPRSGDHSLREAETTLHSLPLRGRPLLSQLSLKPEPLSLIFILRGIENGI